MKFCPKCKAQYDDDARICQECGVLLWNMVSTEAVEEPEAPQTADPNAPVFLMQSTDERELAMVEKMLEAQRVPFFTKDLETGEYMRVMMGFSVYGKQLYVRAGDYAYCSQMLARLGGDYDDDELEEAYDEYMMDVDPDAVPEAEQEQPGGGHKMLLGFLIFFIVLIVALLLVSGKGSIRFGR